MAVRSTAPSAFLSALVGLTLIFGTAGAHAGSAASAACARSAEQGQSLRDEGKLAKAREAFAACLRPECPKVIATECASWLDDVTARQPSIVVVVKTARGADVTDAKVYVDGALRADAALGRLIVLDPGAHVVRAEVGGKLLEETVVVREREKDRRVVLSPPAPPPPQASPVEKPIRLVEERPVPVVAYVLSGVAVVIGSFGIGFGVSAANGYADLERTCPNGCTESDILGLRAKTVTADIAFGLAIAATLGAVVVYLTRPVVTRPEAPSAKTSGLRLDWSRGAIRF